MPSSHPFVARTIDPIGDPYLVRDQWLEFNEQLNCEAVNLPNESMIERLLETIQTFEATDHRIYWLALARLTELVLKLAGDYADNCEIRAAGDLLVNPRHIDIYRRGFSIPVKKNRHGALSDQFSTAIGHQNPVAWLSRETVPQIRSEALLPHLHGMLSSSGYVSDDYLADLVRRMCRVADTIAFLTAWQISNSGDLLQRMETADSGDRELIAANLCMFDTIRFDAIGDDIETLVRNGEACSRFLNHSELT